MGMGGGAEFWEGAAFTTVGMAEREYVGQSSSNEKNQTVQRIKAERCDRAASSRRGKVRKGFGGRKEIETQSRFRLIAL